MHLSHSLLILSAGLGAVQGSVVPKAINVCPLVDITLQLITNIKPVAACQANVKAQASDWCRDFLKIKPVTTYLTTTTPLYLTATTTTTTASVTFTTLTTTTTETTATETSTIIEATTTTTTVPAAEPSRPAKHKRRAQPAKVQLCPTIKPPKYLPPILAAQVSKACSCLKPAAQTVTKPVTTAPTSSTTSTATALETTTVSTETDVLTETSRTTVTEATTTTEVAVTTETALPGCAGSYFSNAYPAGNYNILYDVRQEAGTFTEGQCCKFCSETPNCMASYVYYDGSCVYAVQTQADTSAPIVSAQCPLGGFAQFEFVDENYQNPVYKVYRGPCVVVP